MLFMLVYSDTTAGTAAVVAGMQGARLGAEAGCRRQVWGATYASCWQCKLMLSNKHWRNPSSNRLAPCVWCQG